jgi:hypothetical protein
MFWSKKKKRILDHVEAGFHQPKGMRYLEFLHALHTQRKPQWYLEVGTEKGFSLAQSRCNTIAIDPEFKISAELTYPSQLHLFQMTSDDFFASQFLARNGIAIDLSFLDGLHLFEFLLRDFMNAERASKPDGMITLHDCVPFNRIMAARYWDKPNSRSWTGDVWKILPILHRYRPDLKVEVIDCSPTGLVLISNLDPENQTLQAAYASILDEWNHQSLDDYGLEKMRADFPFVSATEYLAR